MKSARLLLVGEFLLRVLHVDLPQLVLKWLPRLHQVVTFLCGYTMLQALGLFWGFLFDFGAVLGERLLQILSMPLVNALCVILVHCSVMLFVLSFARTMWILMWQSTRNFPFIRRTILTKLHPPQSLVLRISVLVISVITALLVVPEFCEPPVEFGASSSSSSSSSVAGTSSSPRLGHLRRYLCQESYIKFLSDEYPFFQRSMRLTTVIFSFQFIQGFMELVPRWKYVLPTLSKSRLMVFVSTLALLNAATVVWSIEWIARHFEYKVTPFSGLSISQWEKLGIFILLLWVLWCVGFTRQSLRARVTFMGPSGGDLSQQDQYIEKVFGRLKYTFVVSQAVFFCRAVVHPSMGFVHAQLELTIINFLLPSMYVLCLIALRYWGLVTWRRLSVSLPFALALAGIIFWQSKMTQLPAFGILFMYLLHFFLQWSQMLWKRDPMGSKTAVALTKSTSNTKKTTQSKSKHRGFVSSLFAVPPLFDRFLMDPYLRSSVIVYSPSSSSSSKIGHRAILRVVYIFSIILVVFFMGFFGFVVLSKVQLSSQWFPDATLVRYNEDESVIKVHHFSVANLEIGLANETHPPLAGQDMSYAICPNKWNDLSIVDFALLSEAAYLTPNSSAISQFLHRTMGLAESEVIVRVPSIQKSELSQGNFFEAFFPLLNVSVISVKGTDMWRFGDFAEDAKMFAEPVIFAALSTVFPTIRIWPDVTFSTLIELYSETLALLGLEHESWYYHELLGYVDAIQDRQVILTGHSMGAGLAKFVGTLLDKRSVTISPPGFVQSYSKMVHSSRGKDMKVDRNKIHHLSVSVIPEYDPVTMVDVQAGLIQRISCDSQHLSIQLSCHMLESTICNLLAHCGDARRRIASCQFDYHLTSLKDEVFNQDFVLHLFETPKVLGMCGITGMILFSILGHRKRRKASSSRSSSKPRASSFEELMELFDSEHQDQTKPTASPRRSMRATSTSTAKARRRQPKKKSDSRLGRR